MKSADIEVGKSYYIDSRWSAGFKGTVITKDWRVRTNRWESDANWPDTVIGEHTIPGRIGRPYTDVDKAMKIQRYVLVVDEDGTYNTVLSRNFVGDYDTVAKARADRKRLAEDARREQREKFDRYRLDIDTRFRTAFGDVPDSERPDGLSSQQIEWALASFSKGRTHEYMEIALWAFSKGFAYGEGQE